MGSSNSVPLLSANALFAPAMLRSGALLYGEIVVLYSHARGRFWREALVKLEISFGGAGHGAGFRLGAQTAALRKRVDFG